MRQNSLDNPFRLAHRGGLPASESACERLYAEALKQPGDSERWRRVFHAAVNERNSELARHAAERCGADKKLLLAELAIVGGRPAEAIVLLEDEKSPLRFGVMAWAYFCLDDFAASVRYWGHAADTVGRRLGAVCEVVWKAAKRRSNLDIEAELKELAMDTRRDIASVACAAAALHYFEKREYRKVMVWARRGEWILPRHLPLKRLIARAATALNHHEMAISRWTEIMTLFPDDAEAYEMLGNSAAAEENKEAAVRYWERALQLDPFRGHLRISLGDFAREQNQTEAALGHYETAARIDPQNRIAISRLADLTWSEGWYEDAVEYFRQLYLLGFEPEDEEEQSEILGYLFAEHFLSGEARYHKDAQKFFDVVLEKYSDNLLLRLYSARCLIGRGDLRAGRALVEGILKRDPLLPEAVYEMGNLYILEGRAPLARPFLEKAASIDPDVFYIKELGKCYLDLREWSKAEATFKRALAGGAEDDELMLGLYAALFERKKYAQAENMLRRIMHLEPEHLLSRVYLAEICLCQGRYVEADELLAQVRRKAVSPGEFQAGRDEPLHVVGPEGVLDWLTGFVHLLAGRAKTSARHFHRALETARDLNDWNSDLRGRVLEALGREKGVPKKLRETLLRLINA